MDCINLDKTDIDNLAFFRYKEIKGRVLLTNEAGEYLVLSRDEFKGFIRGNLDKNSLTYSYLDRKNFIKPGLDKKELIQRYRAKYSYLRNGTSLHIVIPTLRCNLCCLYCQASALPDKEKEYNMDIKTAAKTIDTIFQSPSPHITIEFQGGEPLLNWDIVKYIIEEAEKKNKKVNKNLSIILVSNLTLMTRKRLDFLLKHNVAVCTSLDGPKFIHDRNRPMHNGKSSYNLTAKWIRELSLSRKGFPNALVTLSRFSLDYPQEIINEYLQQGMTSIPLRPVTTLGYGGQRRNKLGLAPEQFLRFYRQALEYMIEVCEVTGKVISERMAKVCLQKILRVKDPGYLDMRSPCGAGCGQLAYQYEGSVYTCDEARMLSEDAFKLGNVHTHTYKDLVSSKQIKTAVFASCLDGLYCDYCVYKPYCGVCPVVNWQEQRSIYSQPKRSFLCQVYEGKFDILFEMLQDKRKSKILKSWLN
jgi:uncharacterized protein